MTSRQSFALSAVVVDVNDTERLKAFAKTVVNDTGRFGTILTVDRFEGRLTWHVSVTALSDQFKPILLGRAEAIAAGSGASACA